MEKEVKICLPNEPGSKLGYQIQKLTDDHIKKIETAVSAKEKELR
jgi:ribosome recycling factor